MSWRTGFLISAAINVLIVGALLGFVFGGGLNRVRGVEAGVMLDQPRVVMASLPADVRHTLRRELVHAWFQSGDQRAAWRAANAEVLRQLQAEPYNAAAMEAALQHQRDASGAVTATFHHELAQAAARLTPEQRRNAAAALMRLRTPRVDASADLSDNDAQTGQSPETPRERLRERIRERLRERQQN